MRKNLKRCLALVLSVIMMMAMASVAVAESEATYTITINDGAGDASENTYAAYLIASFSVSNNVYVDYEIQESFKSVVADQSALEAYASEEYDSAKLQKLANDLAAVITSSVAPAATSSNGIITVSKTGYYLLVETGHGNDASIETRYILKAVDSEFEEVTLKTSKPSVEKKILLESSDKNVSDTAANTEVDADVVAMGDTITYQLEAQIPSYPSVVKSTDDNPVVFTLTDVMSAGLTFKEISSVTIGGTNVGYTSANTTSADGSTEITITINPNVVLNNGGETVVIVLTATLNENALTGEKGNPNSVDLTYTNGWDVNGTPDSTDTTEEDTVITYTGELNISKVDENDNSKVLSGAGFEIKDGDTVLKFTAVYKEDNVTVDYYRYNTNGIVTEVVTGEDGTIKLVGLDAGAYTATEKTAPAGYNVDSTPQNLILTVSATESYKLEMSGDYVSVTGTDGSSANTSAQNIYTVTWKVNDNNSVTITNKQGLTLPGTGGMGTTIFTIGGIALVALATIMFIIYVRKQKEQA